MRQAEYEKSYILPITLMIIKKTCQNVSHPSMIKINNAIKVEKIPVAIHKHINEHFLSLFIALMLEIKIVLKPTTYFKQNLSPYFYILKVLKF